MSDAGVFNAAAGFRIAEEVAVPGTPTSLATDSR
jgi:hypothetical protein